MDPQSTAQMSEAVVAGAPNAGPVSLASQPGFQQPLSQISDFLHASIQVMEWEFVVHEQKLLASEVADPLCMLGAVLWKAEKNVRIVFSGHVTVAEPGATLGVKFCTDEHSAIGAKPVFDTMICTPRSPALLFLFDVLNDAYVNHRAFGHAATLDYLIEEFIQDRDSGVLPWLQAGTAAVAEPGPNRG